MLDMTSKEVKEGWDESISLAGFSALDPFEFELSKKVISNYVKRIKEISDYQKLKLHLKSVHDKKVHLHIHFVDAALEVKAHGKHKSILGAKAQHRNPYTAISEALDKLLSEIQHNSHKEEWKELRHKQSRKKKT